MPAGDRLVKSMRAAAKQLNPPNTRTDLVYGVVQKENPLTVLVDNRLTLTEDFLIKSPFCYSTGFTIKIDDHAHSVGVSQIKIADHKHTKDGGDTSSAGGFTTTPKATCGGAGGHEVTVNLWDNLKVGDKLVMLRVHEGQEYMILYRDKLDIKVSCQDL